MSPRPSTQRIEPTALQQRILAFAGHAGIVDAGGRGGGKSFALLLDVVDHLRDAESRVLVLRESHAGLAELSDELLGLATAMFGAGVTRSLQRGELRAPNGAIAFLANMDDANSYAKYQGRSFSMIAADELGNYTPAGFSFFMRTLSNLRAAPGKETRIHITANPAGRSHAKVLRAFIRGHKPWTPWRDEFGLLWVVATSTLRDNPHLNGDEYERRLLASCGGDRELARAWLAGDWAVLGGSMFCPPFDERVHIRPDIPAVIGQRYTLRVAGDWGTASPSTALLIGRLREPVADFRQGDICVFDEVDTAVSDDDLSHGTGMGPAAWAEEIKALVRRNGVARVPQTVSDDARGLGSETVCEELRKCGVPARRPYRKDRVGAWALLRGLLASAVERDGRPAIWFSPKCVHLLRTLPEAPRSPHRAEDTDPRWTEDHWLDALAYGVQELHGQPSSGSGKTTGWF